MKFELRIELYMYLFLEQCNFVLYGLITSYSFRWFNILKHFHFMDSLQRDSDITVIDTSSLRYPFNGTEL